MPTFLSSDLLRWFHLVLAVLGGGSAMVALLLSGLEEEEKSFQGLAASVWSRMTVWGVRLAFLTGFALVAMAVARGEHPFAARYLCYKTTAAILLLVLAETATRPLARGKRGAALLTLFLFLLVSFFAVNQRAFGGRVLGRAPLSPVGTPTLVAQ